MAHILARVASLRRQPSLQPEHVESPAMPAAQQPVALNGEPEKRQQVPSWLLQVANPQQATTPAPATGAQQGADSDSPPAATARIEITGNANGEWKPHIGAHDDMPLMASGDAPVLPAMDTLVSQFISAQSQCGDKKSVSRQQLQAVLQATRAIAERIVHEPTFALDPLTIKRAITLLRLIAQQQQILDALIDDCRLTQPRCQITSTDLLPHVESLSSWYLQAFQMLHHYCNKNPIKRMVKSKKEETKVKFFEEALTRHGDVLAEVLSKRLTPAAFAAHLKRIESAPNAAAAAAAVAAIAAADADAAAPERPTSPTASQITVPARRAVSAAGAFVSALSIPSPASQPPTVNEISLIDFGDDDMMPAAPAPTPASVSQLTPAKSISALEPIPEHHQTDTAAAVMASPHRADPFSPRGGNGWGVAQPQQQQPDFASPHAPPTTPVPAAPWLQPAAAAMPPLSPQQPQLQHYGYMSPAAAPTSPAPSPAASAFGTAQLHPMTAAAAPPALSPMASEPTVTDALASMTINTNPFLAHAPSNNPFAPLAHSLSSSNLTSPMPAQASSGSLVSAASGNPFAALANSGPPPAAPAPVDDGFASLAMAAGLPRAAPSPMLTRSMSASPYMTSQAPQQVAFAPATAQSAAPAMLLF